ncbi:MAG: DUF3343 domain-containing protein [Caldicoprobacterales bacterium]|nr:DUF3343 domain-containing protein [Clostridiales bacterium]
MPFQESFDILAFRSRQHAFHFSQVLRDHGIASQIMSTPKEVALGCGLSLRFSPYMTRRVLNLYKHFNSPVTGCYHVVRTGSETKVSRIPM